MALTPTQEKRAVAADDRVLGFLTQRFHDGGSLPREVAQGSAGATPARAADVIDVASLSEILIRIEQKLDALARRV